MKIQFASDIHMEFGGSPLRRPHVVGEVLILAGDIAESPTHLAERLPHLLPPGLPVIFVLGNHEFFTQEWEKGVEEYRKVLAPLNVHVLEEEAIVLDGIRFLGCTLWTDFFNGAQGLASEQVMPDFCNIWNGSSELTWPDVAKRFRRSRTWIESEMVRPHEGPTVVVTHHAPSSRSNAPQFAGSPISGAFYSNLEGLIEKTQPALWVHGHMHTSSDYRIGKTRVVCNPYGIGGEAVNPDWNPTATVEV